MPLIGAAGGAAVNAIFMRHYQEMADGHFTVRRLERKYGPETVKAEYRRVSRKEERIARAAARAATRRTQAAPTA